MTGIRYKRVFSPKLFTRMRMKIPRTLLHTYRSPTTHIPKDDLDNVYNTKEPVRIRVRIDPPHHKRRLNGAILQMRPEKPRPRVTAYSICKSLLDIQSVFSSRQSTDKQVDVTGVSTVSFTGSFPQILWILFAHAYNLSLGFMLSDMFHTTR
jgi:hypothetical protein